jgi:hypothetical protein
MKHVTEDSQIALIQINWVGCRTFTLRVQMPIDRRNESIVVMPLSSERVRGRWCVLVPHHFKLDEIEAAYDLFAHRRDVSHLRYVPAVRPHELKIGGRRSK